MNYDGTYFSNYVFKVVEELKNRKIKYNKKYLEEIKYFCWYPETTKENYPEHNDRYLKQCYYNLQEKYDRGIITKEEFEKIENRVKEILGGKIC